MNKGFVALTNVLIVSVFLSATIASLAIVTALLRDQKIVMERTMQMWMDRSSCLSLEQLLYAENPDYDPLVYKEAFSLGDLQCSFTLF
jgi:hypothetical protein